MKTRRPKSYEVMIGNKIVDRRNDGPGLLIQQAAILYMLDYGRVGYTIKDFWSRFVPIAVGDTDGFNEREEKRIKWEDAKRELGLTKGRKK